MTEAATTREPIDETAADFARFYKVLGTFNAAQIARVVRDPAIVTTVTDEIFGCIPFETQCGIGYEWDPILMQCVKISAEIPD